MGRGGTGAPEKGAAPQISQQNAQRLHLKLLNTQHILYVIILKYTYLLHWLPHVGMEK